MIKWRSWWKCSFTLHYIRNDKIKCSDDICAKAVKKNKETFPALFVGVHQSKAILRDIYEANIRQLKQMIEHFRNFHFHSCIMQLVISLNKRYSNNSYILIWKTPLLCVRIGCSLLIPMGIAKYMLVHFQSPISCNQCSKLIPPAIYHNSTNNNIIITN